MSAASRSTATVRSSSSWKAGLRSRSTPRMKMKMNGNAYVEAAQIHPPFRRSLRQGSLLSQNAGPQTRATPWSSGIHGGSRTGNESGLDAGCDRRQQDNSGHGQCRAGELLSIDRILRATREYNPAEPARDTGAVPKRSRRQADRLDAQPGVAEHPERQEAGSRAKLEEGVVGVRRSLPVDGDDQGGPAGQHQVAEDEEDRWFSHLDRRRDRSIRAAALSGYE